MEPSQRVGPRAVSRSGRRVADVAPANPIVVFVLPALHQQVLGS
ncbi:hypothetical protein [Actinomycetospora flava]|uniref:Uncharacterized protein n=1 Tax=Actinomycetospora flava TaxID=3129232 RepID=A0ABU8M1I5_9PSEU